jgi:UDP-glucose 4-epimerase
MRIFVTGANGFLGREVVRSALAAGHDVTAFVRRLPSSSACEDGAKPTIVVGDLRFPDTWTTALTGADVIIHAAAAAGGTRAVQLSNSVLATERLLEQLDPAALTRFVHVSSLSVYDYSVLATGSCLDEDSQLEPCPQERDAYTEAKLVQERLVREWCDIHDVALTVVRPGAIVGPGKSWNEGAALTIGRLAFVIAPRARFRMTSVWDCADAIVRAAESREQLATINIVDDELPSHLEYFRAFRRVCGWNRIPIPIPWFVIAVTGRLLEVLKDRLFDGRLRVPELLDRRRQEARWKPLQYPNDRAHRLGWSPSRSLTDTVAATAHPNQGRSR